jgi:Cd2+/Zn2+-exporting ATPase
MTFSGLLPEDKEAYVARLQENGEIVCFIGDGINDGPALVRADLGVGIGSRANTLALESSGVILMGKGLSALPSFIQLGKKTTRTIMENIGLALFLNMFLIIIAAYGIINPVMGAIGHQVATMAVLFNSIRLSRYLPE